MLFLNNIPTNQLHEQNTTIFEQLTCDDKFKLHVQVKLWTQHNTDGMVVTLDQFLNWSKKATDTTITVKEGHTSWYSLKIVDFASF